MATLLDICPVTINVCVKRGDTTPWTYTIQNAAGVAINITGFSYLLTVDPSSEPTGSGNNLFQLTGTITDGPNGIVQFEMTAVQADQAIDTFFYDVQQTDAATKLRTIIDGTFEFEQDITK